MTDKQFLLHLYMLLRANDYIDYEERLREIIYSMNDNVSDEVILGGVSHEDIIPLLKELGYDV